VEGDKYPFKFITVLLGHACALIGIVADQAIISWLIRALGLQRCLKLSKKAS